MIKPRPVHPPHTLPKELKERTDSFLNNPKVYPFPALGKVLRGSPEEVNFDRVWALASNPEHWGDDSYHKITDMENPGNASRQGAWFDMTHGGFPLMPTVFGKQAFAGVIAECKVDGQAGQRVGTVSLVELNTSGKTGWHAVPEHIQTFKVIERTAGEVGIEIGVRTAPSSSPEWLRKSFLIPWGRWHIQTDEADKLRTFSHRVFPDRPLEANPVQRGSLLGGATGMAVGAVVGGVAGALVGALVGAGTGYYLAAENLKKQADTVS